MYELGVRDGRAELLSQGLDSARLAALVDVTAMVSPTNLVFVCPGLGLRFSGYGLGRKPPQFSHTGCLISGYTSQGLVSVVTKSAQLRMSGMHVYLIAFPPESKSMHCPA